MKLPHTIDFETESIEPRPAYPPKPVGVAVWEVGRAPVYMAWGHPTGNNCTRSQAKRKLRALWRSDRGLLCHHAKFDLEVAEVHLDLPLPPWHRVYDTMFDGFLHDPYAETLSLKGPGSLSDRVLTEPYDDDVLIREWIYTHIPGAKKLKKQWRKYIALAPGDLVRRYAIGDVRTTRKVFEALHPTFDAGQLEAYNRERRLIPALIAAERRGIPVAHERLARMTNKEWKPALETTDCWIRRRLQCPGLDINKPAELADAIEKCKRGGEWILDEWVYTDPSTTHPDGQRSTAQEALKEVLKDRDLLHALDYRSKLTTSIRNFAEPWLEMCEASGGKIYTNFNQVAHGDDPSGTRKKLGARTGRLSTNPNFQNIPKQPKRIVQRLPKGSDARDYIVLPKSLRVPALPHPRAFIKPLRGDVLFDRDYAQQELRVLAHYVGGALAEEYRSNPKLDIHDFMMNAIQSRTGILYPRGHVKNIGFAIVYGAGVPKSAKMMGVEEEIARGIRTAYGQVLPGLGDLQDELRGHARAKEPVRTWGGRLFECEKPRAVKGEIWTFEYKMLNTLVQGSSAEITKEAWVRAYEADPDLPILLTVHDEFLGACAKSELAYVHVALRRAMESIELDVPLFTDAQKSMRSWAELSSYHEAA